MSLKIGEVPLGQPRIRYEDLNSSSSVYDYAYAAPSDATLKVMWIVQASVLVVVVAVIFVVLAGILTSSATRRKSFNVYLIFLMVPDFFYSSFCIITCVLCAVAGHYSSPAMCRWQAWYLMAGCSANAWINAVIVYELYQLLKCSQRREHYQPPTVRVVVRNCSIIYVSVGFFATWAILGFDWLPAGVDSQFGVFCFPSDFDTGSTIFLWLVILPLAFGIPYCYVAFAFYDIICRSKLLPPPGIRRSLVVYFFRIVFVFAVMWVPSVIAVTFLGYVKVQPWVRFWIGVWSHLQGLVSALVTLLKPDIAQATRNFLCCKCSCLSDSDGTDSSSSRLFDVFGFRMRSSSRSGFSLLRRFSSSKNNAANSSVLSLNTDVDGTKAEESRQSYMDDCDAPMNDKQDLPREENDNESLPSSPQRSRRSFIDE